MSCNCTGPTNKLYFILQIRYIKNQGILLYISFQQQIFNKKNYNEILSANLKVFILLRYYLVLYKKFPTCFWKLETEYTVEKHFFFFAENFCIAVIIYFHDFWTWLFSNLFYLLIYSPKYRNWILRSVPGWLSFSWMWFSFKSKCIKKIFKDNRWSK